MKALLLLALAVTPAMACDWEVSKRTDPMTDVVTCSVMSLSGKIAFYRHGTDRANVVVDSAYSDSGLMLRVDDNEPVRMGRNAYDRGRALDTILPQLQTGQRLRVRFRDYPHWQEGEVEICNLPELLESCTE